MPDRYDNKSVKLGEFRLNGTLNQTFFTTSGSLDSLIYSQGNPRPYKRGGSFRCAHHWVSPQLSGNVSHHWVSGLPQSYEGRFTDSQFVGAVNSSSGLLPPPSVNDMLFWGTRGYERFAPPRAINQVGQMVGELVEFRSLIQGYRQGAKRLSDLFLDYEFGRGALVRDLVQIFQTADKIEKRLLQLKRDNGKPVRREGLLTETHDSTITRVMNNNMGSFQIPILNSSAYANSVTWQETEVVTKSSWKFSGRFRYWIPSLVHPSVDDIRDEYLRLQGGNLSLSLVWNLIPWSWLVDWFGNIGDILSNIDLMNSTGLVSDYAYVMNKREVISTSTSLLELVGMKPFTCSSVMTRSYLARDAASPYGFGLNPAQFSTEQLAILSALGISRMPNHARF